jgi:hypothetical protein
MMVNYKEKIVYISIKLKKFRHYLLERYFIAKIDHKLLVSLIKNKMTILIEGWIETIMKYNFSTEYIIANLE